jgi:hypothetical protein
MKNAKTGGGANQQPPDPRLIIFKTKIPTIKIQIGAFYDYNLNA